MTLGKHLMMELYDCDPGVIRDAAAVERVLVASAKLCKATVVQSVFHLFNPFGVSGVVIIAESHLAIHTWPEYAYVSIDIFTCGDALDPIVAAGYIVSQFKAGRYQIYKIRRGKFDARKRPLMTKPELSEELVFGRPLLK
ncbi:MAG: adenosylmethionine decarboxylase [Elusimicrobiota bacterium]